MSIFILSIAAIALYTIAAVSLFLSLRSAQHGNAVRPEATFKHRRSVTLGLASLAMLMHAWVTFDQVGWPAQMNLPFFTALAVVGLCIVLLQLALCLSQPADYLGLAVYPLAATSVFTSQLSSYQQPTLDPNIQIHVLLSILAYAILFLAAAQAVLVAVQRHYLSHHKPGGFIRALPAFDRTEGLLFSLLGAGFAMLSLSLISGFFFLEDMLAQHLVHKTALSCIAWAVFGALLLGRWRFGWRGRAAIRWTLGGYVLLLLAYFGTKLVLELILKRT